MDRPTPRPDADTPGSRPEADEALVLPSRRRALDLCRSLAIGKGIGPRDCTPIGPILVTGDAGVGKTWLWRRIEADAPPGRRWIAVDLTPSDDPADFYRLIAHELGLVEAATNPPAASRVALVDFLAGREADGERIGLVVEEAHNLSGDLWEEVRILANRLDRPGGFASMLIVGQTSLAIRFSTRPFASMEARLASRVHLGPIGVDEARELLARLRPGRDWADDELELLHRDASGNPRRLLRLAGPAVERTMTDGRAENRLPSPIDHRPIEDLDPTEASTPAVESPAVIASPMPLTGPAKPPILVEENMIEVGWAAEDNASPVGLDGRSNPRPGAPASTDVGEEAVEDHYAALQAWREWSENQARRTPSPAEVVEDEFDDEDEIEDDNDECEATRPHTPLADRPTVRAESEQKFAPFGQLFSRMAQAREPE
jgi:type II secretory pathway predicted ATPase ExeA